ncbi:MAG: hypothetical protein R2795_21065 [Saprospiraceae bacterium]
MKEESPRIQYRGHVFRKGQVWIKYELQLSNDRTILVAEERPECDQRAWATGLSAPFKPRMCQPIQNYCCCLTTKAFLHAAMYRLMRLLKSLKKSNWERIKSQCAIGWSVGSSSQRKHYAQSHVQPIATIPNPNKVEGAEEEEERPLG